jgi:hypothetical protein
MSKSCFDEKTKPIIGTEMAAFRVNRTGWQTRIDTALNDWLRTHLAV